MLSGGAIFFISKPYLEIQRSNIDSAYNHYKYVCSYSAEIDCGRQNLTSTVNPRTVSAGRGP